jgi:hypothetical protein
MIWDSLPNASLLSSPQPSEDSFIEWQWNENYFMAASARSSSSSCSLKNSVGSTLYSPYYTAIECHGQTDTNHRPVSLQKIQLLFLQVSARRRGRGDWWRKDRIFSRRILFSYLMEGRLWPEIGLIASLRMEKSSMTVKSDRQTDSLSVSVSSSSSNRSLAMFRTILPSSSSSALSPRLLSTRVWSLLESLCLSVSLSLSNRSIASAV